MADRKVRHYWQVYLDGVPKIRIWAFSGRQACSRYNQIRNKSLGQNIPFIGNMEYRLQAIDISINKENIKELPKDSGGHYTPQK